MKFIKRLGDNKLRLRKIKNSNNGVVGIVVAVLLVGLLVTLMSIIQVYYVPKWMKEKESEHMDEISNHFSQLKFAIDTQTALNESGVPMTTPVTLGSTELPFFMSRAAYGQLDILDDACTITFYNYSGYNPYYELGVIRFSSINAYLEDQSFVYESGAIITSQYEGNIVAVKPFFKPDTTSDFKIKLKLINISSIGGKTTSQISTGATAIQTEYSSKIPNPYQETIPEVESITIDTEYPNAWALFLESALENAGKVEGTDFSIATTAIQITVNFIILTDVTDLPTIELEEYLIDAQIGPGWIEK